MYALRFCGERVTAKENKDGRKNSRRPGKWDDVVAKRPDPRDAQLSEADALTVRHGRHSIHESQIMFDILMAASGKGIQNAERETYIILEAAELAPVIAFFQV
jgi:hypothetical protein